MDQSITHTNILVWNARGITSKKYEFKNYLDAKNIPLALISEIHLQLSLKFKCTKYCQLHVVYVWRTITARDRIIWFIDTSLYNRS
jgi:hypothetical protein